VLWAPKKARKHLFLRKEPRYECIGTNSLEEAAGNGLTHGEFLELVLQDELLVRKDRQMQRRLKAARFRELKTLEDFDWQFNPSIKKKQVYDLASGRFVREARDCLWLGPPGTGKSHLCQAIGYQAIKMGFQVLYRSIFDVVRDFLEDEAFAGENKVLAKYLKPDLLIIDDMGSAPRGARLPRRVTFPTQSHRSGFVKLRAGEAWTCMPSREQP